MSRPERRQVRNPPRTRQLRRNPLEAFSDVEALYEDLSEGGPSFYTRDEISAFASYCMRALQSCPEFTWTDYVWDSRQGDYKRPFENNARGMVDAFWSRMRQRPPNETVEFGQRLKLIESKLWADVWDAPIRNRQTHDTWTPALLRLEAIAEDGTTSRVNEFVGCMFECTRDGRNLGRSEAGNKVRSRWLYRQLSEMTTREGVVDWCRRRKTMLVGSLGVPKMFDVRPTGRGTAGIDQHVVLDSSSPTVVDVDDIVKYAVRVERMLALADELESTGKWAPEHLSFGISDRLCDWIYVGERHPGDPVQGPHG